MSEGRFRLLLTLEPESVHTRCLLHRLACQGVNSRDGACGGAGRDLLSNREAGNNLLHVHKMYGYKFFDWQLILLSKKKLFRKE